MTTHFEGFDIDLPLIKRISYDKLFCHLFITFKKDGKVYRYLAVPSSVYDEFVNAFAKGKSIEQLFNAIVRDVYAYDIL